MITYNLFSRAFYSNFNCCYDATIIEIGKCDFYFNNKILTQSKYNIACQCFLNMYWVEYVIFPFWKKQAMTRMFA